MLHQEHESVHESVVPLKNLVDWIRTRREKKLTTSKMYILTKKGLKVEKHVTFSLHDNIL